MGSKSSHTHLGWIDWARAFGALSIVLLHVIIAYFNVDGAWDRAPLVYLMETAASIPLFRWAVPVFFMISGTLLLDPNKEMGLTKAAGYIWRICLLLLTFGYFFCILEATFDAGGILALGNPHKLPSIVSSAFINLVQAKSWDHLWFLYAMLLLYVLMVPLRKLRLWLYAHKHAAALEFGLIALLWLFACGIRFLYMAHFLMSDAIWGSPLFMALYQLFPLMYFWLGRWLFEHAKPNTVLCLLGLISVSVTVFWLFYDNDYVGLRAMLPEYGLIAPYSALIYVLFKHFATRSIAFTPLLRRIAKASLGIYILHPLFMHVLLLYGSPLMYPLWLVQFALFAVSLSLSLVITELLQETALFKGKL